MAPKLFKELHELFKEAYSHTRMLVTVGLALLAILGTTDSAKDWVRSVIFEKPPPK